LVVKNGRRDDLLSYLKEREIPCGVYYPIPLYEQEAYKPYVTDNFELANTKDLCQSVISLPIHTEMDRETQEYIIQSVTSFFYNN